MNILDKTTVMDSNSVTNMNNNCVSNTSPMDTHLNRENEEPASVKTHGYTFTPVDTHLNRENQESAGIKTHTQSYTLNEPKLLGKKMKSCEKNPMVMTIKSGNNVVIEFSTTTFEIVRNIFKMFYNNQPNTYVDFEQVTDTTKKVTSECYKVSHKTTTGERGMKRYTINIYRTTSKAVINGPEANMFAQHEYPHLESIVLENKNNILESDFHFKHMLEHMNIAKSQLDSDLDNVKNLSMINRNITTGISVPKIESDNTEDHVDESITISTSSRNKAIENATSNSKPSQLDTEIEDDNTKNDRNNSITSTTYSSNTVIEKTTSSSNKPSPLDSQIRATITENVSNNPINNSSSNVVIPNSSEAQFGTNSTKRALDKSANKGAISSCNAENDCLDAQIENQEVNIKNLNKIDCEYEKTLLKLNVEIFRTKKRTCLQKS